MSKSYVYELEVTLRPKAKSGLKQALRELEDFLTEEYQGYALSIDHGGDDEREVSFKWEIAFPESLVTDDEEPTDDAILARTERMRSFVEQKFDVRFINLLHDDPGPYLIEIVDGEEDD